MYPFSLPVCLPVVKCRILGCVFISKITSSTGQVSVRALSTVYFWMIHHRQDIIELGAVQYGKALKNLHNGLQDAEKAWSIQVLNAALTLQLYEVCYCIFECAIKILTY
jgi:hypothetical protein